MFATYVHDLNPVLVRFTDVIQLRWYGLAYLAAFVIGAWLLNVLSKRGRWVLPAGSAGDFIAAAAIFGVFLGGRLGYMLWYYRPPGQEPLEWLFTEPLTLLKVWKGGMASHGGILGLMIFTWFYARRKKVSWTGLGDGLCVVAPIGLLLGRAANFVNGELYGRVAHGVSWAVKFPKTLWERPEEEGRFFSQAMQDVVAAAPEMSEPVAKMKTEGLSEFGEILGAYQRANPAVSRALEPWLEPRHPSQIYEGLLEGGALFAILWWVRNRWPQAPHGLLTGLFFILYAVFRIFGEHYREPDAMMVGLLTSGQFLSTFMILIGAGFIIYAARTGARPRLGDSKHTGC